MSPHAAILDRLLLRLRQVRDQLGQGPLALDADTRFGDALDSMGFVEFLALVAEDCGVSVETIEQATGRHYGSISGLAAALKTTGIRSATPHPQSLATPAKQAPDVQPTAWLTATVARLPVYRQPASAIDELLRRPPGWLEKHAGIEARSLWLDEDPLDAAVSTAQDCLAQAGIPPAAIGALLVTSEAPPVLPGLAAALHPRLGLPSAVAALEIGGACTGFLTALWTASRLLVDLPSVLVIAVEAHSRWLSLAPTPAGEAAVLFGDGAAACLLTAQPTTANALCLRDILLGSDASGGSLLRVEPELGGGVRLHMEGIPLAHRAVRTMADAVRQLSERQGLTVHQLGAVVAHGGNGRMPALLARQLGLPPDQVWSETARAGNLGAASVPVAWTLHPRSVSAPVIWAAIGAGLQWGAALFDAPA
jgi:3-oxoacyl-[acyl-carrier-protein] synthase-3